MCIRDRARKTAIFFYENGSRGRDVLTDVLGDAELKSIMSVSYTHLDVYKRQVLLTLILLMV